MENLEGILSDFRANARPAIRSVEMNQFINILRAEFDLINFVDLSIRKIERIKTLNSVNMILGQFDRGELEYIARSTFLRK